MKGDIMWVNIYNKLYNLDKYNMIQGDVTAHGKTYLSLSNGHDDEVKIQMSKNEIDNVLRSIPGLYQDSIK